MNLVANILLYAEDRLPDMHHASREWLDNQLSGSEPFLLCWQVLNAFLRIATTNARLHRRPLTLKEAGLRVDSWLDQPCVRTVQPPDQQWKIFYQMLQKGSAVGNLVSDAHLAALAIEHNGPLCSTDSDFARFPRLKWVNPIR